MLKRIWLMEKQRLAKLEREVEDALVKAIWMAKAGSLEQKDLIVQWEKTKAVIEETTQVPVRQSVRDGNANNNET